MGIGIGTASPVLPSIYACRGEHSDRSVRASVWLMIPLPY